MSNEGEIKGSEELSELACAVVEVTEPKSKFIKLQSCYKCNEEGYSFQSYNLIGVNGEELCKLSARDGEPEDATLARDFSDFLSVDTMIKRFYVEITAHPDAVLLVEEVHDSEDEDEDDQ